MSKGRNSTVVGFRVSDEEWERLRSAAARAGRDESVGDYCKRIVLKEGTRLHKRGKVTTHVVLQAPVEPGPPVLVSATSDDYSGPTED